MLLVRLAIAWLVGIALGSWLKAPWIASALLALLLSLLLALWYRRPHGRRLLSLALAAALGMLRCSLAQPSFGAWDVAFYAGQAVELRGTVAGEGEERPAGVSFPLAVDGLRRPEGEWLPVHGKVLVQGPPFFRVEYGDRLLLSGTPIKPSAGGQFSYRDYLAQQGIYVLLQQVESVHPLPGRGGFSPARLLFALRGWACRRIESLLPEPQAALLVGILLGSRAGLPPEVQEAFSRSGTSHILAISGWNISIVGAFLAEAGRRLPGRKVQSILIVAGIALYTLLVGAGSAVLRAALMGILYVLAQCAGRPGDGLTALLASAWAMTLWNPTLLRDVGFQLSFGATLGMFLFVPVWTEAWARWPPWLAESLAATLSSQLLTWPLLALYFRTFSLVVPLANLLACPALAPLMLLGALALLLGGVPGVGWVLRGTTWLVASYMLGVVGRLGEIPWAAVKLPAVGPAFLLLYYGGIAWWWYRWRGGEGDRSGPPTAGGA